MLPARKTYFGIWPASEKFMQALKTGIKILEQMFRSDWLSNLNEPIGRQFHQEVAFSDMIFL